VGLNPWPEEYWIDPKRFGEPVGGLINLGAPILEWVLNFIRSKSNNAVDYCSSRLHVLDEPGGKSRIITIADIFSQSLLHPIHESLFTVLKSLPSDGTFNQQGQVKRIME